MKTTKLYLALVFLLLIPVGAARGSSIIPQPWQQLVNDADLVGVVECVTAGEIVARYRVVESWKGPKTGTKLTIRGPASVYEPTLPIALCGQRFIVAAWKFRSGYNIRSGLGLTMGPGGSLPLWWRSERQDYFIPSMLQITPLPVTPAAGEGFSRILYGYRADLASFRRDVRALLRLPERDREAAVLHAAVQWYLIEPWHAGRYDWDGESVMKVDSMSRTNDVDALVGALADFSRRGPGAAYQVLSVLSSGRAETLAALARIEPGFDQKQRMSLGSVTHLIRRRTGLDSLEHDDPIEIPPRPSRSQISRMEALLEAAPASNDRKESLMYGERRKAFEVLSAYDPGFVSNFLATWEPASTGLFRWEGGFGLGSFFAWRCTRDRIGYLRALLKARDPYIRVAGAIYLVFESEAEGVRALRQLSTLPDDAGAWAALNLARRGEKGAMTRALEVLRSLSGPGVDSQFRRNLQKRLYVLLSNSAAQSGVRQPEPWSYFDSPVEQVYKNLRLISWWKTNETRLVLYDPWYEGLKAEKIE